MGGNKEMLKIQAERLAVIYKLIGSSGNGVPETEFARGIGQPDSIPI
jgi:hypothetical protein